MLSSTIDLKDSVRDILTDVPNWLPLASEAYNISPRLSDYILVPTVSMPSDLPNRNQQAFPFRELTRFQGEFGMPMYKTWNGKPTHYEHQNSDPSKAKGIILSTLMRPIKNSDGNIHKVIKLTAWDRTRDSVLANDILSKKRRCYSMGAYAKDYICSVCGTKLTKGGCEHVTHGKPDYRLYSSDGNKQVTAGTPGAKLAYYNTFDCCGFEISSVSHPAYLSSSETNYFTLDDNCPPTL